MRPERQKLYKRLASTIGHTPLTELQSIAIPNNNKILAKEEYRNPTGSHYDRIILALLKGLECQGEFNENDVLTDTTTGNSGASFAWLCRALKFDCEVIIPRDMPAARIAQIRSYGATIEYSESGRYVEGLIAHLQRRFENSTCKINLPDHAGNTEFPPAAMRALGEEIAEDLRTKGYSKADYFICALGNGASTYVGEPLKAKLKTKTIGFEPIESPTLFLRKYSKEIFRERYGVEAELRSHELIGTGPGEVDFLFPLFDETLTDFADIQLVTQHEWEPMMEELADLEGQHVGRTSAASVCAALELAEHVSDSTILVLFYDQAWKYLDLHDSDMPPRTVDA
jgi:cysteine synthase A